MLRDGMEELSSSVDAVVRLAGRERFRLARGPTSGFIVRGQCRVTRAIGHCARASGTLPEWDGRPLAPRGTFILSLLPRPSHRQSWRKIARAVKVPR